MLHSSSSERSANMRQKQLRRHQGQWWRRRRRCSRCWSPDSPAAHGEDHSEADCPAAPHGGPQWSRWICPEGICDLVENLHRSRCLAGIAAQSRGAHAGASLLAELVAPHGTHVGAVHSWSTASHGKDPHWSSSWRTAARTAWEGPTLEKLMKDCLLWVRPYAGAGEGHLEEGAAEKQHYEMITSPTPRPSVPLGAGR